MRTTALILMLLCVPATAQTESLRPFLWENRVIVVFSPDQNHPQLLEQRHRAEKHRAGFAERDLRVVEVVGSEEHPLRKRFKAAPDQFRALLIGKDGTVKDRSTGAFETERLFEVIDAMPMRRREMRERR